MNCPKCGNKTALFSDKDGWYEACVDENCNFKEYTQRRKVPLPEVGIYNGERVGIKGDDGAYFAIFIPSRQELIYVLKEKVGVSQ